MKGAQNVTLQLTLYVREQRLQLPSSYPCSLDPCSLGDLLPSLHQNQEFARCPLPAGSLVCALGQSEPQLQELLF